jgi:hypothetical protein
VWYRIKVDILLSPLLLFASSNYFSYLFGKGGLMKSFIGFTLLITSVFCLAKEEIPPNRLQTLKKDHPRLLLSFDLVSQRRLQAQKDPFLQRLLDRLQLRASSMLDQEPIQYELIGPRLLSKSRTCLHRVTTLALAYYLTGRSDFAARAEQEMLAAASFPDWNPSHFLDVAEMTNALSLGYDWLYYTLDDSGRLKIEKAIYEYGLKPGLEAYAQPAWWVRDAFNWNQVCNGGLTVGALALADRYPTECNTILNHAIAGLPYALASYAPDGGWAEGPGYWSYATRYTVYMLEALQTALGTDFDLTSAPGLDKAGHFPIHATGPTNLSFNYADANPHTGPMASLFWLAEEYDLPLCALEQRDRLKREIIEQRGYPSPFDILWYQPDPIRYELPQPSAYYSGTEVIFMRSEWNDPNAFFIGCKGGDNQANHAHLDLGTFVFDALGVRWIADLGSDDYNLPDYWNAKEGGTRWSYFRLGSKSHNTLTLNNDLQRANAKAPVTEHHLQGPVQYARIDLSQAYHPHALKVERGLALVDKEQFLIQDEITWKDSTRDYVWHVMTDADIDLLGSSARLYKDGKTLYANILAPQTAVFDTADARAPSPERANTGFKRLIIRNTTADSSTRIAVVFARQVEQPELKPLSDWGS